MEMYLLVQFAIFTFYSVAEAWPDGTWGIPMPKDGCPATNDFHWSTGQRVQEMETGSEFSENSHFKGFIEKYTIATNYCMKTSQGGTAEWPPGQYCIFKKGACPQGLEDGYIYWDDAASFIFPSKNSRTGVLPDGDYGKNTKIYYCCSSIGNPEKGIVLPTKAPFYLLKRGRICQKVNGMDVVEEWIKWHVEESGNLSGRREQYPSSIMFKTNNVPYLKVFYCYYTPKSGLPQSAIIAIAVIGVLLLVGILAFIIGKFIFACHKGKREETPEREENGEVEMRIPPTVTHEENLQPATVVDASQAPPISKPGAIKVDTEDDEPLLVPPAEGATGGETDPMLPKGEMPPPPEPYEKPPTYHDVLREDGKL